MMFYHITKKKAFVIISNEYFNIDYNPFRHKKFFTNTGNENFVWFSSTIVRERQEKARKQENVVEYEQNV